MDVYRREIEAEKNFFRYALFVSFFPQLEQDQLNAQKFIGSAAKSEIISLWENV